ncbi:hypothetical protein K469DRAFT_688270 [Zopfia rhizophila CBS 207.26]|uniref:Uncharacterized protein n=1 Tax=Zopfia rhizophila CBS 207.26 TaxID=1314779 RepID=A0A6A6E1G9_9PEZI|nr:hypothetical protein K469DRAFT_688270 [Zopfia rhizophila CBS 207.26]
MSMSWQKLAHPTLMTEREKLRTAQTAPVVPRRENATVDLASNGILCRFCGQKSEETWVRFRIDDAGASEYHDWVREYAPKHRKENLQHEKQPEYTRSPLSRERCRPPAQPIAPAQQESANKRLPKDAETLLQGSFFKEEPKVSSESDRTRPSEDEEDLFSWPPPYLYPCDSSDSEQDEEQVGRPDNSVFSVPIS